MKKVVAYCRTAWASQSDPLSGARLQAKAIRRYARRQGFTIREMYMDAGVSGMTLKRPGLRRLLADCRAGKVKMVVTQDADRLSRDISQLIALLHIFRKAGVRVKFNGEQGRTGSVFLKTVLSVVAKLEEAKVHAKQSHLPIGGV